MEKKKQENKMRRDQLNDEYLELLDKQRLYFKTVKDFKEVRTRWRTPLLAANAQSPDQWTDQRKTGKSFLLIDFFRFQECRKNEMLLSKLRAKGAS